MDIIKKRESFLNDFNGHGKVEFIHSNNKYKLAFRPFVHTFVDEDEREFYLGKSGIQTNTVSYMFREDPPIPFDLMKDKIPMGAPVGSIYMYLIYHNPHTLKTGIVCASVENNLEYGSKHLTIVNYINKKVPSPNDLVFVAAGELRKCLSCWEFNFFSGSFTEPRITEFETIGMDLETWELDEDDYLAMKSSLTDWVFIKGLLSEAHPSEPFEFSSRGFEMTDRRPLIDLLKFLPDKKFYPYVVPNLGINSAAFEKAVAIVGTFVNLKGTKKKSARVTTWATEESGVAPPTTSISMREVDENPGQKGGNLLRGKGGVFRFNGHVEVLPYKSDLRKALDVLRQINAKKLEYGRGFNPDPVKEYIDIFRLSGKTYNLSVNTTRAGTNSAFRGTLTVSNFLASSNDDVYLGVLDDKPVVLKVKSLYPFETAFYDFNVEQQTIFYGTDIYSFVIPGTGALGVVYPYLGRTISDMSITERMPLYGTFKSWLINRTIKTARSIGDQPISTRYNDYKPENITFDEGGKFHLIDFDVYATTDRWYGPTSDKTFVNQMFAVLLIINWFKTGEIPFDGSTTGADKIEWVNKHLSSSDLKTFFDILLDDDLSVSHKIELFKE